MPDFLRYFRNATDVVTIEEGHRLFSEGETGTVMFGVLDGTLALSIEGREIERVEPGGVLGEMALVDGGRRTATATALTAARVARIDEREFVFMVHESPTFALDLMREFGRRLRHWHDTLAATVEQRSDVDRP